jgi:hypothetical protein
VWNETKRQRSIIVVHIVRLLGLVEYCSREMLYVGAELIFRFFFIASPRSRGSILKRSII